MTPRLHLDTPLASAMRELFEALASRLLLKSPVTAYLAGGMAVHLYTRSRVTGDVDAEFAARLLLPSDLAVPVRLEDGSSADLYIDANYNPMFSLLHEDYQIDSLPLYDIDDLLRVRVLAPTDIAVSKISRFAEVDREDIAALVQHGLTSAEAIERRAREALVAAVGPTSMIEANLRDALAVARDAAPGRRN